MNIFDRFIYKMLFLTFILLSTVVLDRYSIISLEKVKSILSENINMTSVIKTVNGDLNFINLEDNIIQVNTNDNIIEEDNGYYIYKQKYKDVYNQSLGSVVKIEKNNGLFIVYILDENNNYLIYSDLKTINIKIYQIVKVNEIIGECNDLNSNNEYRYYFKLKINEN